MHLVKSERRNGQILYLIGDVNPPPSVTDGSRRQKIIKGVVDLSSTIAQLDLIGICRLLGAAAAHTVFSSSHCTCPLTDHLLSHKDTSTNGKDYRNHTQPVLRHNRTGNHQKESLEKMGWNWHFSSPVLLPNPITPSTFIEISVPSLWGPFCSKMADLKNVRITENKESEEFTATYYTNEWLVIGGTERGADRNFLYCLWKDFINLKLF